MRTSQNQFIAFAHVVREGSFSRAADRMGLSQSAVTQNVSKLETLVGARLLHRSRDGITLTRTGQEFYELADRLLTLDVLIQEKITGHARLEQGHLSVIANAPSPALGLIARFRRTHPSIEVSFALHDWTTAMRLLRNRQVDIAIVTEPDRAGDCKHIPITTAAYVVYMPADHPLAARSQVSLHDLATETVLIPEEGSFTERKVQETLAKHRIRLPYTMRTTTFPVMKEAILQKVGVGIFLENSAHPNENILSRPIREMPARYRTAISVPADKYDLNVVRSFVELAREDETHAGQGRAAFAGAPQMSRNEPGKRTRLGQDTAGQKVDL